MADSYPFNGNFVAFVDELVKSRKFPFLVISLISFCIYDEFFNSTWIKINIKIFGGITNQHPLNEMMVSKLFFLLE